MSEILTKKIIGGKEFITFSPTPKMRVFALAAFADPENRGREPEKILESLGMRKSLLKDWQQFNPYWEEWLGEMEVLFTSKNRKNMLDAVGFEKALSGDFNFWKQMALKEKVIDPESATINIPINLSAFDGWTDEQIIEHRNTLLSNARSLEDKGRDALAPGDIEGESEGDARGAIEVQPRSLVLDEGVGTDRERARER